MPARRKNPTTLAKFIAIGIPLLTFVAGNLVQGFNLAQSVAKKEDVKEALKVSTDYTDQRVRSAQDYTDAKVQTMLLGVSELKTEIKTSQASLTTQVENLVKAIDEMRRGRVRY